MSSNILGSNALHTQYDSTNITATGVSDPIVSIAEKGVEAFADAQGFYLVNELPWLQYLPSWLPGMGFLKTAEDGYKKSMDMYKTPYEKFKKNLVRLEGYI